VEPIIRYAMNRDVEVGDDPVVGDPIEQLSAAPTRDLHAASENPHVARFIGRTIERPCRLVA
jgi:hypothetical protein